MNKCRQNSIAFLRALRFSAVIVFNTSSPQRSEERGERQRPNFAENLILVQTLIASLLALTTFGANSFGDESPTQGKAKPSAKSGEDDKPSSDADKQETKPAQPSLLDRLTKELFKELDDAPPAKSTDPKEDKLDHAASGMRSAGDKLGESQTGDETRKIQEQVIRDLDDLIKQLQQPPPNGGGGGGGGGASGAGGGGKMGRAQLQKLGSEQSSRKQQSKQELARQRELEKSGGKEKKNAGGSEERTEAERKAAEEANRKRKLELDVWGHLPPHLREQLLNTYGERMLPKYEQLVKQFYEALSEQSEPAPRR